MELVEFDPRCLDELVRMWRASFETAVGVVDPHPIEGQQRYFMQEVLPRNDVRVARVAGELAGFVAVAHGFEPTWQLADVRYEWVRSSAP